MNDTPSTQPAMTAEEVLAELRRRGVEINVGACGCCDSPWVKIRLDGLQVFSQDRACIDMIPDEDELPSHAPDAVVSRSEEESSRAS